ncbi:hypothetical protein LX36DRAFT_307130 [Colletotrichum falcatum]|nr:hypothetical protein LX36DRAFT_307130 [Colletotrichum falcatum]
MVCVVSDGRPLGWQPCLLWSSSYQRKRRVEKSKKDSGRRRTGSLTWLKLMHQGGIGVCESCRVSVQAKSRYNVINYLVVLRTDCTHRYLPTYLHTQVGSIDSAKTLSEVFVPGIKFGKLECLSIRQVRQVLWPCVLPFGPELVVEVCSVTGQTLCRVTVTLSDSTSFPAFSCATNFQKGHSSQAAAIGSLLLFPEKVLAEREWDVHSLSCPFFTVPTYLETGVRRRLPGR